MPQRITTTCPECGEAVPEAVLGSAAAYCTKCRYHGAEQPKPWDADLLAGVPDELAGYQIETGWLPSCDGDADENSPIRDWLGSAISELLELLASDSTVTQAGQRVHFLAFKMGVSPFKTQVELAEHLDCSKQRISQIPSEMPQELQVICRLKRRAALPGGRGAREQLNNE